MIANIFMMMSMISVPVLAVFSMNGYIVWDKDLNSFNRERAFQWACSVLELAEVTELTSSRFMIVELGIFEVHLHHLVKFLFAFFFESRLCFILNLTVLFVDDHIGESYFICIEHIHTE